MWSIAGRAGTLGRRPKVILLLACLALLPTREASCRDILEELAASQNLGVAHQEAMRAYQRASLAIDWHAVEEAIDRLRMQLATLDPASDEARQRHLELSFRHSELDAIRDKAHALGVRPPDDDSYYGWEQKLDAYAERSRQAIRNLWISFGANLKCAANQVGACRQVCEPDQRCEVREACEWKVESGDGRIGQCTGGNWNPSNCRRRFDCDKTEKVCETVENCRIVCD